MIGLVTGSSSIKGITREGRCSDGDVWRICYEAEKNFRRDYDEITLLWVERKTRTHVISEAGTLEYRSEGANVKRSCCIPTVIAVAPTALQCQVISDGNLQACKLPAKCGIVYKNSVSFFMLIEDVPQANSSLERHHVFYCQLKLASMVLDVLCFPAL